MARVRVASEKLINNHGHVQIPQNVFARLPFNPGLARSCKFLFAGRDSFAPWVSTSRVAPLCPMNVATMSTGARVSKLAKTVPDSL